MADSNDDDNTSLGQINSKYYRLSVRQTLRPHDEAWAGYYSNHPFTQIEELRTIDTYFNKVIDGTYLFDSLDDLPTFLELLTKPEAEQYYMIHADALTHELPDESYGLTLLGYDLSDWTSTSTLTNCGTWTDELAVIAASVNKYGLLDLDRAKQAQQLLPRLWNNAPHSDVTIWAVFALDG